MLQVGATRVEEEDLLITYSLGSITRMSLNYLLHFTQLGTISSSGQKGLRKVMACHPQSTYPLQDSLHSHLSCSSIGHFGITDCRKFKSKSLG
jgi:hypothetical protein